jgi:hypothetical protein
MDRKSASKGCVVEKIAEAVLMGLYIEESWFENMRKK